MELKDAHVLLCNITEIDVHAQLLVSCAFEENLHGLLDSVVVMFGIPKLVT
jgi:hypothetical protein